MNLKGNIGFNKSDHPVLTLADISLELRYTAAESAAADTITGTEASRAANGGEENSTPPEHCKIIFCQ